jgi:hypothetical protein
MELPAVSAHSGIAPSCSSPSFTPVRRRTSADLTCAAAFREPRRTGLSQAFNPRLRRYQSAEGADMCTAYKYSNAVDRERLRQTATAWRRASTTAKNPAAESSHRGVLHHGVGVSDRTGLRPFRARPPVIGDDLGNAVADVAERCAWLTRFRNLATLCITTRGLGCHERADHR